MIEMLNNERTRTGLSALQVDMQLVQLARLKSQCMVDNNYIGHTSPTLGSVSNMLRSNGVRYIYAGENIAGASTVQRAHTSLMNSSGHRQNILNGNYTHVGIGIRNHPVYGLIVTQLFVGR